MFASAPVLATLALMFGLLGAGSLVRLGAVRAAPPEVAKRRLASLASWWVLAVLLAAAALAGRPGAALLFGLTSLMALDEYRRLAAGPADRGAALAAFALTAVLYAAVAAGFSPLAQAAFPAAAAILLAAARLLHGGAAGYVRSIGGWCWAVLTLGYGLAHVPLLAALPEASNPRAGPVGWLLYLVLLTQMDDIVQALVGRRFGRRRITPRTSPNKTWEGFLAGVVATPLLALALAGLLTPWMDTAPTGAAAMAACIKPLAAGLLIALSGFFGDINMSAMKRDMGVKDSGRMVPGQGGVIDRIDSLTFTAPVFYWFLAALPG